MVDNFEKADINIQSSIPTNEDSSVASNNGNTVRIRNRPDSHHFSKKSPHGKTVRKTSSSIGNIRANNDSKTKISWTSSEDNLLKFLHSKYGDKWTKIALHIKGRTGKQCRERWHNQVDPNIKSGNWTREEDIKITDLYKQYGSKWSAMAKELPGRTANAIKNRWYFKLTRYKHL